MAVHLLRVLESAGRDGVNQDLVRAHRVVHPGGELGGIAASIGLAALKALAHGVGGSNAISHCLELVASLNVLDHLDDELD